MNKAQLIEALSERLGDKRTAGAAVNGLVDVIVRTVNKGEKVNITGFGVFEKRARAARTARNPRTGETVKVKKTTVPAFRAGTGFKDVISGAKKLPRVSATRSATARGGAVQVAATVTRAATTRTTPKRAETSAKVSTTRVAKPAASASGSARVTATSTASKKPTRKK